MAVRTQISFSRRVPAGREGVVFSRPPSRGKRGVLRRRRRRRPRRLAFVVVVVVALLW